MANIKFHYCYRDAGNYKNHGSVTLSNPGNLSKEMIEKSLLSKLIDEQWFYAHEWGLPALYFEGYDPDLDHSFHEFLGLEETEETIAISCSVEDFLKRI